MLIQPTIRALPRANKYEVVTPYRIRVDGILYMIPRGFVFNGASIPRVLWGLVTSPYNPRILVAALVHDYLYRTHLTNRKRADQVFRVLLRRNQGFGKTKIALIYRAVRMFGAIPYKRGINLPVLD
jgi:hypothetical protein